MPRYAVIVSVILSLFLLIILSILYFSHNSSSDDKASLPLLNAIRNLYTGERITLMDNTYSGLLLNTKEAHKYFDRLLPLNTKLSIELNPSDSSGYYPMIMADTYGPYSYNIIYSEGDISVKLKLSKKLLEDKSGLNQILFLLINASMNQYPGNTSLEQSLTDIDVRTQHIEILKDLSQNSPEKTPEVIKL